MRRLLPGLLLFTAIMATAGRWAQVSAEECDNPGALSDSVKIQQCIGKYNGILDAIAKAISNNQEELNRLKSQVLNLKSQINSLDKRLTELSGDIFDREVKVGVQQELLAARVRTHYIRKREDAGMLIFFSSNSGGEFFRDLAYREKESTAALKVGVDKQAGFLEGEVKKASAYVSDLGGKIAALTARQQALLAEKTGTYATSVGDVPLADDPAARPDY